MHILDRFFIRTSVMVALVHVYNLLCALDEQQTNFLCSSLFSLRFKSVKALSSRGGGRPTFTGLLGQYFLPPLYTPGLWASKIILILSLRIFYIWLAHIFQTSPERFDSLEFGNKLEKI